MPHHGLLPDPSTQEGHCDISPQEEAKKKESLRYRWLRLRFRLKKFRGAIGALLSSGALILSPSAAHAQDNQKPTRNNRRTNSSLIARANTSSGSGSFRAVVNDEIKEKESNGSPPQKSVSSDTTSDVVTPIPKKPQEGVHFHEFTPPDDPKKNIWDVLDDIEDEEYGDIEETRGGEDLLPDLSNPHTGQLEIDFRKLNLIDMTLDKQTPDWPLIEGIRYGKKLLLGIGALIDELRPKDKIFEQQYSLGHQEFSVVDEIIDGLVNLSMPQLRISNGIEFKHRYRKTFHLFSDEMNPGPQTRVGFEFRHRYKLAIGTPELKDIRIKAQLLQEIAPGIAASLIYRNEFDPEQGTSHHLAVGFSAQLAEGTVFRCEFLRLENGGAELSVGFEVFEVLTGREKERQREFDDTLRIYKPGEASRTTERWDESLNTRKAAGRLRSRVRDHNQQIAETGQYDR